jgi:arsenate reductase
MNRELSRRLLAEFVGSAFLAALVIGSGIAAQQLSPNDTGLALLENAAATAAGLFAIILMFGPVSGRHFNPVVSLVDAYFGGLTWRDALAYIPAQIAGCVTGAIAANGMSAPAAISISTQHRASGAHLLPMRSRRSACCSSSSRWLVADARVQRPPPSARTSAPPTGSPAPQALPTPRSGADLLRHIRWHRAGVGPGVTLAQVAGGVIAIAVLRVLYPDVTPEDAADVVMPHTDVPGPRPAYQRELPMTDLVVITADTDNPRGA